VSHTRRQCEAGDTYLMQVSCKVLFANLLCVGFLQRCGIYLHHATFLLGLFFDREDGGDMFH
jgi:hypothetical protein